MTKQTRRDTRTLDNQVLHAIRGGESTLNKQETLASSILKKRDDAAGSVIDKLG